MKSMEKKNIIGLIVALIMAVAISMVPATHGIIEMFVSSSVAYAEEDDHESESTDNGTSNDHESESTDNGTSNDHESESTDNGTSNDYYGKENVIVAGTSASDEAEANANADDNADVDAAQAWEAWQEALQDFFESAQGTSENSSNKEEFSEETSSVIDNSVNNKEDKIGGEVTGKRSSGFATEEETTEDEESEEETPEDEEPEEETPEDEEPEEETPEDEEPEEETPEDEEPEEETTEDEEPQVAKKGSGGSGRRASSNSTSSGITVLTQRIPDEIPAVPLEPSGEGEEEKEEEPGNWTPLPDTGKGEIPDETGWLLPQMGESSAVPILSTVCVFCLIALVFSFAIRRKDKEM